MKKVHFITETELLYGANNYLKGIFQVDKKDRENGYIDMWYDCDHVKIEGESGRGEAMFLKHENKHNIYIITLTEYESEVYDIIKWWLNGCENEIEINNNWNDWDTVKSGVAYRGGSGYCYALYAKELV
jgi:hypothetical protein